MTTTTVQPPAPSAPPGAEPLRRKWSKAEFYRMAEIGIFQGQRAELIEGEIMVLSPQGPAHFVSVHRTATALGTAFGPGYWVRSQGPLDLNMASEPEPDVAVVLGDWNDYPGHPTAVDAVLVVEVSDRTLAYDTGDKASLYARAGIRDYWVVDLVHGLLEVRRNPIADPSAPFGFRYSAMVPLLRGQIVSPLAVPNAVIPVSSVMG